MAVPPSLRVPWLLQCRPAPPFSGVCWAECAVAVGTLVSRLVPDGFHRHTGQPSERQRRSGGAHKWLGSTHEASPHCEGGDL